ncbi:MAG: hypothetical protein R2932_52925 [Caldilineaceae bacterium]
MYMVFTLLLSWLTLTAADSTPPITPTVTTSGGPFITEPESVNLPTITITQTLPVHDDGSIFLATFRGFNDRITPNYLIILDGNGEYLYFTRTPENRIAMDFKATAVAGTPKLSYFVTDVFRGLGGRRIPSA